VTRQAKINIANS